MLSLAKAAKDYYLQKLGELSPREDYYLRGGTATGRWCGTGAGELGLEGTVSTQGLVRLFDGQHPGTGELLGRRLRRDGVAAWDVTFSADKSVSLLWALGDETTRREVMAGFEAATTAALEYLESVASATRGATKTTVVDEQGRPVLDADGRPQVRVVTWPIASSGYVAARFTEFTSRADDPQLHTHVVVANKVHGTDGVWRSLDGRLLFRHQLAAGYLHEAVLRHELSRRLGVQWQPVRNGVADIVGFTRPQIEAFSQRRRQLEEWRIEHGLAATAGARQVAVIATRPPKQDRRLDELRVEWERRAEAVGLTPGRLARTMGHHGRVVEVERDELFARLAGPEGLTARSATFGEPEVVQHVAAAMPHGASRHHIETLARQFLATSEVVALGRDGTTRPVAARPEPLVEEPLTAGLAAPAAAMDACWTATAVSDVTDAAAARWPSLFTSRELLASEQRVMEWAVGGIGADRWRVPRGVVEATIRSHRELTPGQAEMVRRFTSSGNTVEVGIGPAGSGKTAVMAAIAHIAALTGTPIQGAALAARAAAGLEAATGIPATSVAHLLSRDAGLATGSVLVVDEASMVGTRHLAAVSDLVEAASGKLILVGDPHQLPEIGAGGLFKALCDRLPVVELTDNIRQRHAWERAALDELRRGSPADALAVYREQRRLTVAADRERAIARAVEDWHRHVTAAGDLTSGLLIGYDRDTVDHLNQTARNRLAADGTLEGGELMAGDRVFQAGDRVLCLRNQPGVGVLNGDLATVTSVDPDAGAATVRLDRDHESRVLPAWYLDQGHVGYGYALTGHKAQGVTSEATFTVLAGSAEREWLYVAMSRGRDTNILYLAAARDDEEPCTHVPHPAPRDRLDDLARSLAQRPSRRLGIEQ
jgi:AAA domain/TrwC relaxase